MKRMLLPLALLALTACRSHRRACDIAVDTSALSVATRSEMALDERTLRIGVQSEDVCTLYMDVDSVTAPGGVTLYGVSLRRSHHRTEDTQAQAITSHAESAVSADNTATDEHTRRVEKQVATAPKLHVVAPVIILAILVLIFRFSRAGKFGQTG